jgi:hypothetical protein
LHFIQSLQGMCSHHPIRIPAVSRIVLVASRALAPSPTPPHTLPTLSNPILLPFCQRCQLQRHCTAGHTSTHQRHSVVRRVFDQHYHYVAAINSMCLNCIFHNIEYRIQSIFCGTLRKCGLQHLRDMGLGKALWDCIRNDVGMFHATFDRYSTPNI